MGNAKKLAIFIGTSVDKLQQYLNGEYSLEAYLRLPLLDTGESELSELNDPVDQVINWMGSLSIRDLLRLISAGLDWLKPRLTRSRKLPKKNKTSYSKVKHQALLLLQKVTFR
jgi:hypothetical protein